MFRIPRPSRYIAALQAYTRPLDIREDIIQEVVMNYGLFMRKKPFNLPLSRRTKNVVVSTNIGKIVVKRYRDHLHLDGIRYIHSIISHLTELSFPTIKLLYTPSEIDFISLNDGQFAVFEFVDGFNYSLDFILPADRYRLLENSGRMLASFHQSLNGFEPQGAHHLGFVSYTGSWQRDFNWFASRAYDLVEKSSIITIPDDKKLSDFLSSRVEIILEEFQHLEEKLNNIPLMRTIIHGDFGLHNLIFQKNGKVVLTDFETARLEWRLADLVSTLSRIRSRDTMYHFDLIKTFLTGYFSIEPIPKDEWRYLPDVWMFFKLRSVFIAWNNYFKRGNNLSSAIDAYHQVKWVQDNAQTLLEFGKL